MHAHTNYCSTGLAHQFPKNKMIGFLICLSVHKLLIYKQEWVILHCKMIKSSYQMNIFTSIYMLCNKENLLKKDTSNSKIQLFITHLTVYSDLAMHYQITHLVYFIYLCANFLKQQIKVSLSYRYFPQFSSSKVVAILSVKLHSMSTILM